MADSPPELSVVLPAYEEAANLAILLPQLHEALQRLKVSYEIIVVDSDVPRDATHDVCARHQVTCVSRRGGPLYGDAIRTAQEVARGTYVVLMDADGSHSPDFIQQLWSQRHDADMVIASRYVKGGETDNPAVLIFLSLVVNVVFRTVLGLNAADVSNSFRLYHGDELRSLKLVCNHFDIVEEILVKLYFSRPNYKLKELPFRFGKRKEGQTKRKLIPFAIGYLGTLRRLRALKPKKGGSSS